MNQISTRMNRRDAALAVCIVGALVALLVLMIVRGGKPLRYNHESVDIPWLSLAITGYIHDHGQPHGDVVPLLVEGGYLDSKWVTDGQLLDRWGTPYAIFFAAVDGTEWSYPPQTITIAGQSVSPDYSARVGAYPPMHQIISAGPDRKFGTWDDMVNW